MAGDDGLAENVGPCGGPTAYGWFMYAHDDNTCEPSPEHAPEGEYPADLWACMKKANEMGADYIMFDCDSDPGASAALRSDALRRLTVSSRRVRVARRAKRSRFTTWKGKECSIH